MVRHEEEKESEEVMHALRRGPVRDLLGPGGSQGWWLVDTLRGLLRTARPLIGNTLTPFGVCCAQRGRLYRN